MRAALAGALLAVLAAVETASFPFRTLPASLARLSRSLSGRPASRVDPSYAEFIEAVRRSTPQDAILAILGPEGADLLRAQYELVPRRVVGKDWTGHLDFVAVYGTASPSKGSPGVALPGGRLLRQ